MKKSAFLLFIFFMSNNINAQDSIYTEKEVSINKFIEGTLTQPMQKAKSLIVFIQGSGPVNRNGNTTGMKNDGMRKMAHALAENGIASFRYDKRIFKMQDLKLKEEELRFEDFVTDATSIISYFKEKGKYKNIIIAGHSQGSLVGMLAAKDKADAFISLAGAGQPIDSIIVEQLNNQSPQLAESAKKSFQEIRKNGKTTDYNSQLESFFKPGVQAFLHSWMRYDPVKEIAKLDIPVLIINGTSDIQVSVNEAELLGKANKNAKLVVLDNMTHVFKKFEGTEPALNLQTYNDPELPLHPELIPKITVFVKAVEEK